MFVLCYGIFNISNSIEPTPSGFAALGRLTRQIALKTSAIPALSRLQFTSQPAMSSEENK